MKCVGKISLSYWLWPCLWLLLGLLLGWGICWLNHSPYVPTDCPAPVVNCPEHPDVTLTCPPQEPPNITLSCPEPVINVQCKGKKEDCW